MRTTTIIFALTLAYSACARIRQSKPAPTGLDVYTEVVNRLNTTYGGDCIVMATGLAPATTTVTVRCTDMGGEAIFHCEGGGEGIDPVSLEVCEYGDAMKATCQNMTFTGNYAEDMDAIDDILYGDLSSTGDRATDFREVYAILAEHYDNCRSHLGPGKFAVTVICTIPGGEATLTARGQVYLAVQTLEVCGFDSYMIKTCRTVAFTGDAKSDMKALEQLF